jgi:predicted GNAT family N-acyltransferase
MRTSFVFFFAFICFSTDAQKILGTVTSEAQQPLAFASIIVKGTSKGTSANSEGKFVLPLEPGSYTLVCQHVGYKSEEKNIVVSTVDVQVSFQLKEQQYNLGDVVVKRGEDHAIKIMRNAIRKRSFYEKELKKFESEVYIKGQLQLRDFPKSFMGQKVDFEDGDTSKQKMIFLSETVAKYSVQEPDRKVEVLSTKVSGNSAGFGFSSPQIISFYKNNISLGNLNPRGFISPISANAFNFYSFKFEGTFFENNQMINRIKVTPKRSYEPLFNGYINIIEDEWRIHSLKLQLLKENQMQLADTLVIEQLYVPITNVWVIKQQTIYPAIKMLGFDAHGSFVQVYDKFNFNPSFPPKFFDNTVLKFYDSANKKTEDYWESIRPIPLLDEEVKDYKKKDSLEQARQDPAYMDSLDRARNKISVMGLLMTGNTFSSERKRTSLYVNGLMDIISFNTVEGLAIDIRPVFRKRFSKTRRNAFTITPGLRYGFSNEHFNPSLAVGYQFGKKYFTSVSVSGGRNVYQYDHANPVRIFGNTLRTLRDEINYLKIYEAGFGKIDLVKSIGEGFTISSSFNYENRISLNNSTTYKWKDYVDREYSPNIMQPANIASTLFFNVRWQPGSKYIEYPERKVSIGSKYPTLNIGLTHAIKGLLDSDADFTKWRLSVNDELKLKLAGQFNYRITTGGFLNTNTVHFPDYNHYFGNQGVAAAPYVRSFQMMPYYSYSNIEKFYSTVHVEYHLNGLLTNKIPLFQKLNWFLVTGSNFLYLPALNNYVEVFVGLENILKVGRLDVVKSFSQTGVKTTGIRYTFAGITR